MVGEQCADLGSYLYRRETVCVHHDIDPGDRRYRHGEFAGVRDQRLLPWPGVRLAVSDPAGYDVGPGVQTDDERPVSGDSVDHAL